jgi:3-methyladenine DNA glycosylase AlkD
MPQWNGSPRRPEPREPEPMDERLQETMSELAALGSAENRAGMARYGINVADAFGVSIPELRRIAKRLGTGHELALALWETGNHEARILAALVDDPAQVSGEQLEAWVSAFDSWDLCDQVCSNLFDRTSAAHAKAAEWAGRDEEFVKRAGFALMAALSVHDKTAGEAAFLAFLPLIEREAGDERPYVKKAVNWALRQIGKRDRALNRAAIDTAERVKAQGSRSARWIANDALRELLSDKVQQRLASGRRKARS